MKPNFALNLSHEGISLLHRAKAGWLRVGDVALDAPDLNAQLNVLRNTAAGLDNGGLASKLIIPNSQILYTEVDAPGPDAAARQAQIRDGLVGLTPYDVGDLVFDFRLKDNKAQVAVVARETLAEAEAFAVEYRFNPVTFVGVPVNGAFDGEPYFGLTDHAPLLLSDGESVEPDEEKMEVMGKLPVPPVPSPSDDVDTESVEEAPPEPMVAEAPPLPKSPPDLEITFRSRKPSEPEATPETAASPASADVEPLPQVTFASRRSQTTSEDAPIPPAPPVKGTAADSAPAVASRLSANAHDVDDVPEMPAWRSAGSAGVTPMAVTAAHTADAPPPPKPPSARNGLGAAFARRNTAEPAAKPEALSRLSAAAGVQKEADALTIFGARGQGPKPGGIRHMWIMLTLLLLVALAILVLWSSFFLRSDPEEESALAPAVSTETAAEAEVLAETPLETSGSPETSLSVDAPAAPDIQADGGAGALAPETTLENPIDNAIESALLTPSVSETALPDTTPAGPLSEDGTDVLLSEDEIDVARLQTTTSDLVDAPAPDQITVAPPTMAEAEARYVATGIWQRDPEQLANPTGGDRLDGLYVASIDPLIVSQDAILIPRVAPDRRPLSLSAPAPLGLTFELDDRGLVAASPGGTMAPEGHVVFLGRPPVVPALRPGTPEPAVVALAPTVEPDDAAPEEEQVASAEPVLTPEQERLRAILPQPRPGTLQETNERSRLGGFTRSELALIRPIPRPQSEREEVAAAVAAAAAAAASTSGVLTDQSPDDPDTGTELAIVASLQPPSRPRGFDETVARIRASGQSAPEPEINNPAGDGSVEVAAARIPNIPTRASVAKEATQRNAINLGRINLIGIYGTPSDRRALVRLKSGRYVKVEVGDRVDGGRVAAIGDDELRYVKGGRNITLRMPRG